MVPSCGPQKCALKLILVDVYPHLCFSQPTLLLLSITVQTVHPFVLFQHVLQLLCSCQGWSSPTSFKWKEVKLK